MASEHAHSSSTSNDISTLHKLLCEQDPSKPTNHAAILDLARGVVQALQDPVQEVFKMMFSISVMPCLRIAADLDLFNITATANEGRKTVQALADATTADRDLLARIMRIMAAAGVFKLVGAEEYEITSVGRVFCGEGVAAGVKFMFDMGYRPCAQLPAFLRANLYRNPEDNHNGPHQFAFKTTKNWFDWLEDPEQKVERDAFNSFMGGFREGRSKWFELFPVENFVTGVGSSAGGGGKRDAGDGADGIKDGGTKSNADNPLVVDVGGGYGHDLAAFRQAYPDIQGQFVLEDLPHVIAAQPTSNIPLASLRITPLGHSFFTPQPSTTYGARIYLLKTILHDWPTALALDILRALRPALKPGYSKLVIQEHLLQEDEPVSMLVGGLDMMVMVAYAGAERTENQWRALCEEAGYVIEGVWRAETGDGVIVAGVQ